jgi:hypothetical protein
MKSILRESAFACAVLALLAGVVLADDKKPVKKPDGKPEAGGKTVVLQIDASKLPPDLLKQLIQAAGGDVNKPDGDKKLGQNKKPGEKKPGEDNKPTKKPDGDKADVLKQLQAAGIDASKLSPDVLKQLIQATGGDKKPGSDKKPDGDKKPGENKKPGGDKPAKKPDGDKKSFSLADAVNAAEKHAQGTAVKAESAGDVFVVEVKAGKGTTTVKLDQAGNVLGDKGDKKPDGDKKPGKGNKKNKKKD